MSYDFMVIGFFHDDFMGFHGDVFFRNSMDSAKGQAFDLSSEPTNMGI